MRKWQILAGTCTGTKNLNIQSLEDADRENLYGKGFYKLVY